MRITEPFLYTSMNKQNLKIEVYVIDEVNKKDVYVKTVEVETECATFQLRTDRDELKKVFDQVIKRLKSDDNVTIISRIVNAIGLEMVGEFEQKIHGRNNYITLRFKVRS